jgi:hypothetical protein
MIGTVGRATVPAETGRHGGRPYDTTRPKFLFRFDWTLAASGEAHMKLPCLLQKYFFFSIRLDARGQRRRSCETSLKANRRTAEYRISNVEGWVRFAQSFIKQAEYIIRRSMLNVRCSMFISFFFDLTGRPRPEAVLI